MNFTNKFLAGVTSFRVFIAIPSTDKTSYLLLHGSSGAIF
jgi:hypothetical protein